MGRWDTFRREKKEGKGNSGNNVAEVKVNCEKANVEEEYMRDLHKEKEKYVENYFSYIGRGLRNNSAGICVCRRFPG